MPTDGKEPRGLFADNDHPSVWLVVPTTAILLGQALAAASFPITPQTGAFLLIPLMVVVLLAGRRWALLIVVAGLFFTTGYIRHRQLLHPQFPSNHLRALMSHDGRFYLEGTLIREPEKLPNRSRWLLRAERIWHPTGAEEITGDLLLSVRQARREWRYGDRVRLWTRPAAPRDSGNPGGFNYATYLAGRGIYALGYLENDGEIELLAREPNFIGGIIEDLRRKIHRYLDRHFSQDNGALMKALVVGDMGEIGKEMRANFTAAGVTHVLSISGLHVAMLGLVVFVLIRFGCSFSAFLLLRCNILKVATFCSFLAVVFYTALAGAMVPTVRSAIMIGVYELAVLLDREEEVFTSLTLAAFLIALVWPGVVTDISFQLSFLAVLSIAWGMRQIYTRPRAVKREELPQERSWIKDKFRQAGLQLAVPLLATVGTGPLIAHYFGHLSLAGLVANPVIVPLVGFLVVPLGLSIGLFAVVLPGAAAPLVWLTERLLVLTNWLTDGFASFPLANIAVPSPNLLEVTGLYLLILTGFNLRRSRFQIGGFVLVLLVLAADSVYWWRERWDRKELRVTHLNVGQGDAAVVELPGSKVLLIDAGGRAVGDFDTGEGIVGPFLRSRKILKIDYLMLSHARIDHYGGMRSIVSHFAPEEFWSGPARGRTARFEDLEEALDTSRVKRVTLSDDQPCRELDRARLCVLHSPPDSNADASVAMRLEFGKARVFFAGDMQKTDEKTLLRKTQALESAVLKVPRNGSVTSSSEEFVAAVRPKLAVVSVGVRTARALTRSEVLERYRKVGAEILRTDEDGAIIIETDGTELRYQTYGSGKRGKLVL
ncbi:MAG: DNA internalization-related competence protein ComEC/Rec2 [Candidatus Binatia bacterium]